MYYEYVGQVCMLAHRLGACQMDVSMSPAWVREVGSRYFPGDEFISSILSQETPRLCFMETQVGEPETIPDGAWIFLKVRKGTQTPGSPLETCNFVTTAVKVRHGSSVLVDADDDTRRDYEDDGQQIWAFMITEVRRFSAVRCSYRLRTQDTRPVLTYQLPDGDEATALLRAADNGLLVESPLARQVRHDAGRKLAADKYGLMQKETSRDKTDQGKGTREAERQRLKAIKVAAKQVPVAFMTPRKNSSRPIDSCCESFACSHKFACTRAQNAGLDAMCAFRTRFQLFNEEQRREFLSRRQHTGEDGLRTWRLESPKSMQALVIKSRAVTIETQGLDLVPVCVDFLVYALGISRNKLTQPTVPSPHFQTKMPGRMDRDREPSKNALVMFWLLQLASFYLHDPAHNQIILPFADRKTVYDMYLQDMKEDEEHARLFAPGGCCSKSTFYRTWATDEACKYVKVRKTLRFSLCDQCVDFIETRQKILTKEQHAAVKAKEHAHHMFVRAERGEYYRRRQQAVNHPDSSFSIILDAADQSAFASPHFCNHKKQDDGHWKIAQSLMGVLVHGVQAFGFTFLPNIKHGSNITLEALHRVLLFLWITVAKGGLFTQRTLHIQLDNTTKQCKSKYVLGFCALLVAWLLFTEVIISFLPVGHTHEDIDQLFSRVAQWLRKNNALSRIGFRAAIVNAFQGKWNGKTTTGDIESAANVSDWLKPYLADMGQKNSGPLKRTGITHFHSFRFTLLNNVTPIMQVKEWCGTSEEWRGLDEGSTHHEVFKTIPTPSDMETSCPPAQRSSVPDDPRTRKGVEAIIANRKIDGADAADLRKVLDLISSPAPLPFDWDLAMYRKHQEGLGDAALLGDEEVKDAPLQLQYDVDPEESDDLDQEESSSEDDLAPLPADEAGFVPTARTLEAVYLMRLGTDHDISWGLARCLISEFVLRFNMPSSG